MLQLAILTVVYDVFINTYELVRMKIFFGILLYISVYCCCNGSADTIKKSRKSYT